MEVQDGGGAELNKEGRCVFIRFYLLQGVMPYIWFLFQAWLRKEIHVVLHS